jgi:recombination associated protein RdgC
MLLKNLVVYRLGARWAVEADALEKKLAQQPLQACGSFAMESRGWIPPQGDDRLLYIQNRHWMLALGVENKLLPASVIRQLAKERAAEIATQQGRPVGRKQMRDIKDQVTNELMPRALSRRSTTRAWIDATNRWLVVDAAADKKAEEFVEALRRVKEDFPCKRLDTQRSPGAAMTKWLAVGDAPDKFAIDQDLELLASDASKATVRYARHPLEGKDIRDHIAAGKTATRLGLTWKDRISFVLTDQLHIKRINFLDILNDESGADPADEDEQFDIDFALMTGELSLLLADLVTALDGEKTPAG